MEDVFFVKYAALDRKIIEIHQLFDALFIYEQKLLNLVTM